MVRPYQTWIRGTCRQCELYIFNYTLSWITRMKRLCSLFNRKTLIPLLSKDISFMLFVKVFLKKGSKIYEKNIVISHNHINTMK